MAKKYPLLSLPSVLVLALGGCKSRPVLPALEGPAVVVVGRDAGAGPAFADLQEREPNDTRAAAQTVTVPVGETVLAGTIEVREAQALGDIDRYLFALSSDAGAAERRAPDGVLDAASPEHEEPGRLLAVVLTRMPDSAAPAPLVLELTRAGGSALSVTLAADMEAAGVPNFVLSPSAPLGLAVRAAPGKGQSLSTAVPYQLRLVVTPATGDEEREPNDEPVQATPMRVESATLEMTGHLGWPGDADVFVVPEGQAAPGTGVEAEVDLPPEVTASVSLLGAAGQPIATGAPGRGRLRVAGAAPQASGPLFVAVKAVRRFSFTQPYVLRVRLGLALE